MENLRDQMRVTALALIVGGVTALAAMTPMQAHAAPGFGPQVSTPAVQPVWYDRGGRWHPPRYYGYGYGPPHHYGYWHHRRW